MKYFCIHSHYGGQKEQEDTTQIPQSVWKQLFVKVDKGQPCPTSSGNRLYQQQQILLYSYTVTLVSVYAPHVFKN